MPSCQAWAEIEVDPQREKDGQGCRRQTLIKKKAKLSRESHIAAGWHGPTSIAGGEACEFPVLVTPPKQKLATRAFCLQISKHQPSPLASHEDHAILPGVADSRFEEVDSESARGGEHDLTCNEATIYPHLPARWFFAAGAASSEVEWGRERHTMDRGCNSLEIEAIGQSRKLPRKTPARGLPLGMQVLTFPSTTADASASSESERNLGSTILCRQRARLTSPPFATGTASRRLGWRR